MFVVVTLGIAGLLAALIVAAAVSDFRVAAAAYRQLARQRPSGSAPWWFVGGRVKLTLLVGAFGCVAGTALLLSSGLGGAGRVVGGVVLALATLLLVAGELTRHRLILTGSGSWRSDG